MTARELQGRSETDLVEDRRLVLRSSDLSHHVVQHALRRRQQLLLAVGRVVDEIGILRSRSMHVDKEKEGGRTQSALRPRTFRANHVAAAAVSEGTTARKVWSMMVISRKYLAMVRV